MTIRRCLVVAALAGAVASASYAQSGPSGPGSTNTPSAPSAGPAASPSGGGFSIEAEMFAYKALQADSEAIACDIAGYMSTPPVSAGRPRGQDQVFAPGVTACESVTTGSTWGKGVVIVSSSGPTLVNYQVWRISMLIMAELLSQARTLTSQTTTTTGALAPDLASSFTLAGQALPLVQGVLSLFASSQAATGVAGTIQDQALINDVARQLRNLRIHVLMPDTYASYALGGIDPATSPFLMSLTSFIEQHASLQDVLQRNLVIVAAALKLQADRVTLDADKTKLAGATGAQKQAIQDEIAAVKAEISQIQAQLSGVNVGEAQRTATKAQSIVTAMESFLANLTGGGIAFSAASPPAAPSPPAGGQQTNANSPSQPSPGPSPTPPSPSAGATPPIVAVLAADGLARVMGVKPDSKLEPAPGWRLLWLKALESGGALITETNILGSKVHFSGGAVATFDLFQLDGTVDCSGVTFAYGGYVEAKKFAAQFGKADVDPRNQQIFLRGGCAID